MEKRERRINSKNRFAHILMLRFSINCMCSYVRIQNWQQFELDLRIETLYTDTHNDAMMLIFSNWICVVILFSSMNCKVLCCCSRRKSTAFSSWVLTTPLLLYQCHWFSGNLICLMHMQSMHCLTYSISFIFDLLQPEASKRDGVKKRTDWTKAVRERGKGQKRAATTLISCVYNN